VRENGAKPYYTNSTQLPVDYTPDLFAALDLQDEMQTQYTGGTVLHGFIGEKLTKDGVKKMVKKIEGLYGKESGEMQDWVERQGEIQGYLKEVDFKN